MSNIMSCNKFSVDLSLSQVYRLRKAARGLNTGNEEQQYSLLKDYAKMENENAQPKFKRMYIMYNAKKQGFLNGCKPFIRLDGCHLKGRFCGQLLFATTKDGNDNIFPVAVAVVEQENKDN